MSAAIFFFTKIYVYKAHKKGKRQERNKERERDKRRRKEKREEEDEKGRKALKIH